MLIDENGAVIDPTTTGSSPLVESVDVHRPKPLIDHSLVVLGGSNGKSLFLGLVTSDLGTLLLLFYLATALGSNRLLALRTTLLDDRSGGSPLLGGSNGITTRNLLSALLLYLVRGGTSVLLLGTLIIRE